MTHPEIGSKVGGLISVAFGSLAFALSDRMSTAIASLCVAIAGFIGMNSAHFIPAFMAWLKTSQEARKMEHHEEIQRIQRHDFANKLQVAHLEIEELKQRLVTTETNLSRALAVAAQNQRIIKEIKKDVREISDSGTHKPVVINPEKQGENQS